VFPNWAAWLSPIAAAAALTRQTVCQNPLSGHE